MGNPQLEGVSSYLNICVFTLIVDKLLEFGQVTHFLVLF